MSGVALAREVCLLGARSALAVGADAETDWHCAYTALQDDWEALRARMVAHLASADDGVRRLCHTLKLTHSGYWLVQLCAAGELFPDAAAALSIVAEDEHFSVLSAATFARLACSATGVSFGCALAEAIAGSAARLGLVELTTTHSTRPLTQQALRLSQAELCQQLEFPAQAIPGIERAIHEEPARERSSLSESLVQHANRLLDAKQVLCIRCSAAHWGRQLAIDIASQRGAAACFLELTTPSLSPAQLAELHAGVAVLDLFHMTGGAAAVRELVQSAVRCMRPLLVIGSQDLELESVPAIDMDEPSFQERVRIFGTELRDEDMAVVLARRFRVSARELRAALRALELKGSAALDIDSIAAELRAQGARRMGRLVAHVRAGARLPDLVLPEHLKQQLVDIVAWPSASTRVFEEWHVAAATRLGRGLTCLFSGPPGTGKTFAAQAVANEMGLNLYHVDLSQVVSKYIGETEKALASIFQDAEMGHGVLLFEEADALFGKRSEVKDAHDRYANVEVGYLLQRLESFQGVCILTSNLRSNIDPAFVRRLRFVLEFPVPDGVMRRALWERALPPRDKWDSAIDLDLFAEQFALAGGSIHNIAVAAAHLAAATDDQRLTVEHLVRATYRELEKLGQARSLDAFGRLAVHLSGRKR